MSKPGPNVAAKESTQHTKQTATEKENAVYPSQTRVDRLLIYTRSPQLEVVVRRRVSSVMLSSFVCVGIRRLSYDPINH